MLSRAFQPFISLISLASDLFDAGPIICYLENSVASILHPITSSRYFSSDRGTNF